VINDRCSRHPPGIAVVHIVSVVSIFWHDSSLEPFLEMEINIVNSV